MATDFTPQRIPKFSARYWKSQLSAAENRHSDFFKHSEESIKLYNTTHKLEDAKRKLNIWWQSVQTLLPAYFSRTPKAEVELRKYAGKSAYQTAALIIERNVQYALDDVIDFDDVGYNTALQLLLVGRCILWPRYTSEIEEREAQVGIIQTAQGLVDGKGQPFKGDPATLKKDKHGTFYSKAYEAKAEESAILECVNYRDYLRSDGRTKAEMEWEARAAYLNEEEAAELFGKDTASKLSYNQYPSSLKDKDKAELNQYDLKAKLWEVWCEEADKVYWIQPNGNKTVLESDAPQIKYSNFYPASVLDMTVDPDSMIPTSDYMHTRDIILEIERLNTRKNATLQAIRANAAYDAALGELLENILQTDLKFVPVKNWPSYKARGGLANSVEFFLIEQYLKSLETLDISLDKAIQKLNQALKISDLLNGQSGQYKTATANAIENTWTSMGLQVRQNSFAQFVSRGIQNLSSIICQKYDTQRLLDIADAQELFQTSQSITPEEVLSIIRNETEVCYRIKVAADSMVELDERKDRAEAQETLAAAGQLFQQMQPMVEQYPPLAGFTMNLLKYGIRRQKGGKELEPIFLDAMAQIAQIAQQKQAQAAQQPPDPKIIESQTKLQIAQMEAQSSMQIANVEAQDRHNRSMMELQELQMRMQNEQQKMAMDFQAKQKELDLKAQELSIQLMDVQAKIQQAGQSLQLQDKKINADAASNILAGEIEKRNQDLQQFINQQKVLIEAQNSKIYAVETAHNQLMDKLNTIKEDKKEKESKKESSQPIHINVDATQTKKKKIKVSTNPDGSKNYEEQ